MTTFDKYFDDNDVVTYLNLRGDAPLVVPCTRSDATDCSVYAHLAAFVRGAPTGQVHAFWQAVGKAMSEQMRNRNWTNDFNAAPVTLVNNDRTSSKLQERHRVAKREYVLVDF